MTCFRHKHQQAVELHPCPMVLCLGASGVGKTSLLEQLQNGKDTNESFSPTVPTVGSNLYSVGVGRKQRQSTVAVRELGGAMAPLWHQYYSDCAAVVFVVDSSDSFQVSASAVLFLDVLSHETLRTRPVLLVFNKCDAKRLAMSLSEMKEAMQLQSILEDATQTITIVEASARSAQGTQVIREWIQTNAGS